MIEFVTVFIGLVLGPQDVTLAVSGDVQRIELRLDGALLAELKEEPWSVRVDFGRALRPQRLEAVGFGESGVEIARATQRLNVPRAPAEVSLAVHESDGDRRELEVLWEAAQGEAPISISVRLGELELVRSPDGRFPLPATSGRAQLAIAELLFPNAGLISAQTMVGAGFVEDASIGLTAVPLRWKRQPKKMSTDKIARFLAVFGDNAVVAEHERGRSVITVVRGPGVTDAIEALAPPADRYGGGLSAGIGSPGVSSAGAALAPTATASADERRRQALLFPNDQAIRLVLPYAKTAKGRSLDFDLMATSPVLEKAPGGLNWLLTVPLDVPGLEPELRMGDAVALAGVLAAQPNRRRAVLVVAADRYIDRSRLSLEAAGAYLGRLGVPLYLWSVGPTELRGFQPLVDGRALNKAFEDLQEDLDRQSIAWVEGSWLPPEVVSRVGAPFFVMSGD